MAEPVLFSNIFEKRKSLEELVEESKTDSDFYLYLSVSAVITTLGLLSNNGVVVIGGMLVAPILYPILFLSMAISTSSKEAIRRGYKVLAKATFTALAISFLTALLFRGGSELGSEILMRASSDLSSFLIAFFAGIAAAFAWVKRRGVSATVAGIAVSVSLIPPLATVGIGLAAINMQITTGALTLYIVNILGVLVSALIIFSLFGFSRLQKEQEVKLKEEEIEKKIQDQALADGQREKIEREVENAD